MTIGLISNFIALHKNKPKVGSKCLKSAVKFSPLANQPFQSYVRFLRRVYKKLKKIHIFGPATSRWSFGWRTSNSSFDRL